ncbi:NTPase [Pseudothermotoga thermarum]|uniref:Nucleoside-triphosphatase Theth_0563 n=1 Tax=Pseudothermotoga thermarum DSM 5069 TaxID=688269 RepID=F7YXL1_9THEM|nr:NTPase [Pseudothermotoga thermarum]AEH50652.1 Nucleoside-triphosphatase [Pseudothermotoga thermarum DSM 5069]
MRLAITGRPGVGKTTLCEKICERLREKIPISGFVTKEVREKGKRIGFKAFDLSTGKTVWISKVGEGQPKVGKYVVLVDEFEEFLKKLDWDGKLVVIDEIGPMELKSAVFSQLIEKLLSHEDLLFVVHQTLSHPLVERIKKHFKLFVVTEQNRDALVEEICRIFAK